MTPTLEEFIDELLQREQPRLYFDTTVILDLLRPKRRPQSHELLDLARGNKWECVSSYFALMEAFDIEQENLWFRARIGAGEDADLLLRRRKRRDLARQALGRVSVRLYRKFREDLQDFISWAILDDEGWEEALRLAMNTNVRAADCIHVAAALTAKCSLFITSDEALRDLAQEYANLAGEYVRTASPVQALAVLEKKAARTP